MTPHEISTIKRSIDALNEGFKRLSGLINNATSDPVAVHKDPTTGFADRYHIRVRRPGHGWLDINVPGLPYKFEDKTLLLFDPKAGDVFPKEIAHVSNCVAFEVVSHA